MKHITVLRAFAAQSHEAVGQLYDKPLKIPYWVHLLEVELAAREYFPRDVMLHREAWGHDLFEDTAATEAEALEAGFTAAEVADMKAVTDQPGANRDERKAKTLPILKKQGRRAIRLKLCDRLANVRYGNRTNNQKKLDMYRHEHPAFKGMLLDPRDKQALRIWVEVENLLFGKDEDATD